MAEDIPSTLHERPDEIDAHLMFTALDNVPVVLSAGSMRVPGRLDLADDFGEIAFIDQRQSPEQHVQTGLRPVEVAYYNQAGVHHRFTTVVKDKSAPDRLRLQRPMRIERSERRIVPRFPVLGTEGYGFAVTGTDDQPVSAVADLSNQGLRLLMWRRSGVPLSGAVLTGWLQLPEETPLPISVEVRYVAPYDAGRVSVGARLLEIRRDDHTVLTRHVLDLRDGPGPRAA